MMNNEERKSIKNDLLMIKRGCSIVRKLSPGQIELSILRSVLSAFIPYISIYMSVMIINELIQNRSIKLLILYVGITTGGTLVFTILNNWISKKVETLEDMFESNFENYLNEKNYLWNSLN